MARRRSGAALCAAVLAAALLACCALGGALAPFASSGRVTELTASNFDAELARGPYLVAVGAEWCPHCARLQPVWADLAAALRGVVAVGHVDGPGQRALSARLRVQAYPAILYYRPDDASAREYPLNAPRTAAAFEAWARGGYAATPPLPWHRAPNSALGRAVGRLFALPDAAAAAFARARAATGLGDAALAAACAGGVLAAAAAAIAALDCALALTTRPRRPHQA